MASLVTNDFGRPPRRGHRVRAVLRAIAGCVVLIAAAHAVRDVAPPAFEGILRTFGVRQLCAAVPDVTPCPDGKASEPEASRAADTASTSAGTSELPRWSDGALAWPERYRQWILVGTSLGLGYSDAAGGHESFHHVYLTPRAYAEYRARGTFPDGTMLALEIREPAARVSPAKQGSFSGRRLAVEIALKDTARFPEGWAYFDFGDGRPTARPQASGRCESCHRQHAETDHVFTQFYSGLR